MLSLANLDGHYTLDVGEYWLYTGAGCPLHSHADDLEIVRLFGGIKLHPFTTTKKRKSFLFILFCYF